MIHNTPISFVKALVTKFLSLNSNEEVSKIQIVRKRYIGSKQFQLEIKYRFTL